MILHFLLIVFQDIKVEISFFEKKSLNLILKFQIKHNDIFILVIELIL